MAVIVGMEVQKGDALCQQQTVIKLDMLKAEILRETSCISLRQTFLSSRRVLPNDFVTIITMLV